MWIVCRLLLGVCSQQQQYFRSFNRRSFSAVSSVLLISGSGVQWGSLRTCTKWPVGANGSGKKQVLKIPLREAKRHKKDPLEIGRG